MVKARVDEWGRRLSDAVRAAIEAGDLAAARRLVSTGDGQARSLATEYSYMSRGLCLTARVLLHALNETVDRRAPAPEARVALLELVRRLWQDVEVIAGHLQGAVPMAPSPEAPPSMEEGSAGATGALAAAQERFERAQALLAEEIGRALDAGDRARALQLLDRKEREQYAPLRERLVRFMADSFGWVLRHHGPDELLRFHLAAAEGQRGGFEKWNAMSPMDLAWTTAFLLKQHMGRLEVREDEEKFTLEQAPCGSGGGLRLSGAYEGPAALPFVDTPGPLTLALQRLPVYCSHCAIWNALAPLRWFGRPLWVLERPARPDGSCTVCIYKRRDGVPADYVERLTRHAGG